MKNDENHLRFGLIHVIQSHTYVCKACKAHLNKSALPHPNHPYARIHIHLHWPTPLVTSIPCTHCTHIQTNSNPLGFPCSAKRNKEKTLVSSSHVRVHHTFTNNMQHMRALTPRRNCGQGIQSFCWLYIGSAGHVPGMAIDHTEAGTGKQLLQENLDPFAFISFCKVSVLCLPG